MEKKNYDIKENIKYVTVKKEHSNPQYPHILYTNWYFKGERCNTRITIYKDTGRVQRLIQVGEDWINERRLAAILYKYQRHQQIY